MNPADIPTTDKERKQKEDARDSRKIAEQLAASKLVAIYVPSIETESDRTMLRFRRTLIKEIARNKNRIKSFLYYNGITIPEQFAGKKYWSKRFTKWLQELELPSESARITFTEIIEVVEFLREKQYQILKKIKELSQTKSYKKNTDLLISIPGIELTTAMSFLTEIEDVSRFKNLDKLCSFVELVPMTNSTGEHEAVGGITKRHIAIVKINNKSDGSAHCLKYRFNNLLSFTKFLDTNWAEWKWFNVYSNTGINKGKQLMNFTKYNRPRSKLFIKKRTPQF